MNDKKEPFNAVGDPFFKQVGEEHVEVEEEGNGGRGLSRKRQRGQCTRRLYQQWVREGLNGDFFVAAAAAMDAAMSKLQSMPLQRCNGVCCNGGRGCRPAFSSRSRHLSCGRERERERERVESMFPFDL